MHVARIHLHMVDKHNNAVNFFLYSGKSKKAQSTSTSLLATKTVFATLLTEKEDKTEPRSKKLVQESKRGGESGDLGHVGT